MNESPMNAERLLELYDNISKAPDAVARLRCFVLDLAVRGKLVEQDEGDEPAAELIKRVAARRAELEKLGETKKLKSRKDEIWPFAIPETWSWVSLGELSSLVTKGSSPKWQGVGYVERDAGLLFITSENVGNFTLRKLDELKYVEARFKDVEPRSMLRRNDILINLVGASIGRSAIYHLDEEANINQAVALVRMADPSERPSLEYLLKYLNSDLAVDLMLGSRVTTAQPNISLTDVVRFPVPIPPLAEQHRIVAKVDELMALCDRLEEARKEREETRDRLTTASLARLTAPDATQESSGKVEPGFPSGDAQTDERDFPAHAAFALNALPALTTRPDQIKSLRQTILNLAVRGKLVEQDEADEPASELLEAIEIEQRELVKTGKVKKSKPLPSLDVSLAPYDLPNGWAWARFPELGTFGRGKSKHRPRNDPALYRGGSVPFIQTGDVARSGGRIASNTGFYNEVGLAQSMLWPRGTMCITIAANIADSGILDFDACFPDSVVGLVPASMFDNARYFEYFIRTAKANLLEFAPATAQKNINLGILEMVLIPVPPLAEQHRIVAKVDELMALCDQLEAALTKTDTTRTRLLEALLHEALEPSSNDKEAAE